MASLQYLSLPAATTGLQSNSSASSWAYGSYQEAISSTTKGIYIIGMSLQIETNPAAADATSEILMEIATGSAGSESTKIQLPFTSRPDTITSANNGLGYWMPQVMRAFLPEPYFVPLGTRIAVRATDEKAGAVTYRYKILYREGQPPTVALNSPADTASTGDLTPTLNFTGTDADSDEVEYEVQVATNSSFAGTISGSNLTSGAADLGSFSSVATSSISPTSNNLILVAISLRNGSSVVPSVSSLSGNGLTWVRVTSRNYDTTGTSLRTIEVWRGMGASPTSGALTINFSETETAYAYCVDQFSGVDTSGTNGSGAIVQSASGLDEAAPTGLTVTLSAFSSTSNATYGAFGESNGYTTQAAGSGFTELASPEASTEIGTLTEWKLANDTSVDYSISPNTSQLGGIAIEIKALAPLIDALSSTNAGFTAGHPFASGDATDYTVQSSLTDTVTYYWRVRAIDPLGTNTWGAWSATQSFVATAPGAGGTTYAGYYGGSGWY